MVLLTVLCHADAICRLYFHLIFPMCMGTDSTLPLFAGNHLKEVMD